jgi:hypothetical protein
VTTAKVKKTMSLHLFRATAYFLIPFFSLLVIGLTTPINQDFKLLTDGWIYHAMADPANSPEWMLRHKPWSLRPLTPAIVRGLVYSLKVVGIHLSTFEGFTLVNLIAHWLNFSLLSLILGRFGLSYFSRFYGQFLYIGTYWTLKWSFFSPCYVESTSIFFIFWIVYLTLKKDFFFIPLVFVLGSFQKESIIFLAPFVSTAFAATANALSPKALKYLLVLVVPCLGVIGFLDRIIPELGGHYVPEALIGQVFLTYYLDPRWYPRLLLTPLAGLGALPLFLWWGRARVVKFLRQHHSWAIFALCGLPPLICGWDVSRYYIMLLLPAILLSCLALQPWLESNSKRHKVALFGFLIIHFFFQNHFTVIRNSVDFYNYTRPESTHHLLFTYGFYLNGILLLYAIKKLGNLSLQTRT